MQKQPKPQKIDWGITIFPLAAIVILSLYLVFFPAQAEAAIASLRNLLVNDLGVVYMVFGLGGAAPLLRDCRLQIREHPAREPGKAPLFHLHLGGR